VAGKRVDAVAAGRAPTGVDPHVAHPARVYDYWLGGKDNFAVDRAAAEQFVAAYPGVIPGVRAQRAFLGRAVRYLTEEIGIRQFLDIGTGLPAAGNTHEVAQRTAPECRIVYVDNDPMVLTHARALLTSTEEGDCAYIHADLRDVEAILAEAAKTLDFGKPVAVVLLGIMNFIPEKDGPHALIGRLMSAVVSGSYLVLGQVASDVFESVGEATTQLGRQLGTSNVARTHAEILSFFAGLDLVGPGLVQLPEWRPGPDRQVHLGPMPFWCGVARKP
jgi:hypothetical protein